MDISIEKLRQNYKWFKTEWANKTNRAKNGSGLDPEKEPHWYQILNPVFAETHKPLNLVSSATENDDDDESKPASFSRSDGTDLNDLDAEDKQADDDAPRGIHQNVRQASIAKEIENSQASKQIRKNQVHHAWFVSDSTWNKCFNHCARQKI